MRFVALNLSTPQQNLLLRALDPKSSPKPSPLPSLRAAASRLEPTTVESYLAELQRRKYHGEPLIREATAIQRSVRSRGRMKP